MNCFTKTDSHPNPICARPNFCLLDGNWEFGFDRDNVGLQQNWQECSSFPLQIQVPFVYQAPRSGIGSAETCSTVWYRRTVRLPKAMQDKTVFLHIGAADYHTTVWVNGRLAGTHCGGYSSFQLDITHLLRQEEENVLTIRVYDDAYDQGQIRGKQMWADKPFGCWYTRYTGIWQSVWLEAVSPFHIGQFTVTPLVDTRQIAIQAQLEGCAPPDDLLLEAEVFFEGEPVALACVRVENASPGMTFSVANSRFPFEGIAYWTPEHPHLYTMTLRLRRDRELLDEVDTYFGMRKLEASAGRVLLNHFPFYQKLVLNQGYYPEGFITAESDERIQSDIRLIKALGYNGMRIHQKIESARFLYWCDRLGMVVWEEIPSMYAYEEFRERQILDEMLEIVRRDINHPCIFTWVLFNESWGVTRIRQHTGQQRLTLSAYYAVKAMDPTRFVISNDGWEHTKSDLCTLHDYAADGKTLRTLHEREDWTAVGGNPWAQKRRRVFAQGFAYEGQPYLLSEYGGISFCSDTGWGYNAKVNGEEEFLERFADLTQTIQSLPHIQGYCYTQFTDVEHEQNGLYTIDRQPKVSPERVAKINRRAP